jgi:hypothetical protein
LVVSLLYLLFRRVLAVAALRLRSREFKELEIVVLRHELAVLRRQVARPRLDERDRLFLAAAGQLLGRTSRSFFVRPDTLLGWLASLCGRALTSLAATSAVARSTSSSEAAEPTATFAAASSPSRLFRSAIVGMARGCAFFTAAPFCPPADGVRSRRDQFRSAHRRWTAGVCRRQRWAAAPMPSSSDPLEACMVETTPGMRRPEQADRPWSS